MIQCLALCFLNHQVESTVEIWESVKDRFVSKFKASIHNNRFINILMCFVLNCFSSSLPFTLASHSLYVSFHPTIIPLLFSCYRSSVTWAHFGHLRSFLPNHKDEFSHSENKCKVLIYQWGIIVYIAFGGVLWNATFERNHCWSVPCCFVKFFCGNGK